MPKSKKGGGIGRRKKYYKRRRQSTTETDEEIEETRVLVAPEPVVENIHWSPNSFIVSNASVTPQFVTDYSSELANGQCQSGSFERDNDSRTNQATMVEIKEEPVSPVPNAMVTNLVWLQSSAAEKHTWVNPEPIFGRPSGSALSHQFGVLPCPPAPRVTDSSTQFETLVNPQNQGVQTEETRMRNEMVEKDSDHMYAKNESDETDTEDVAGEYIGYNIVKVERCQNFSDSSDDDNACSRQKERQSTDSDWGNGLRRVNTSLTEHSYVPTNCTGYQSCIPTDLDGTGEQSCTYADSTGEDRIGATYVEYEEVEVETASFQSLLSGVEARGFLLIQTEKEIQFVQHYRTETPSVKLSVCIDEYFNCSVSVHRQPVDRSHFIWKYLPRKFDDARSVMELLDRINKLKVCCGNTQTEYHELVAVGEVLTTNSDIDVVTTVARREGDFGALKANGEPYSTTIRSPQCSLLTDKKLKCPKCTSLNYSLKGRLTRIHERIAKNKTYIGTNMRHSDMTRDELCKKLGEQRAEIAALQNEVTKLKRKSEKEGSELHVARLKLEQLLSPPDLTSPACNGDVGQAQPISTRTLPKLATVKAKNPDTIGGKASSNTHGSNKSNSNKSKKPIPCPLCGKLFLSESSLTKHHATHRQTDKMYMCEKCGRPFKHRTSLETHTQIVHDGEQPTKSCQVCGKLFYFATALKVHMRMHTGEKPNMCEICGKCFSRNCSLIMHRRSHTGEKPYICGVCGLSFSCVPNYKRHMRIVHIGERKYQCGICGKRFGTKSYLEIHTRVHTGEKPYKCTVCYKQFHSNSQCRFHTRSVHYKDKKEHGSMLRPILRKQCTVCNKLVTHLKTHMYTHTGEKPYTCDVCDKSFTIKSSLISHQHIHTGEKPYKCEVCGLAFRNKANRRRHIRDVHMRQKKHRCKSCGELFTKKASLEIHNRKVHTREKPTTQTTSMNQGKVNANHDSVYNCTVCDKTLKSMSALSRHSRTHKTSSKKMSMDDSTEVTGSDPTDPDWLPY